MLTVKLAQTKPEFEEAFTLMANSRERWGLALTQPAGEAPFWLTKQHALPTSNVIVAKRCRIAWWGPFA